MEMQGTAQKHNAVAWVILVSALALHVLDEALTDFLPFYHQVIHDVKESIGFFPMPTFTFGTWLGGLIVLVIMLYALTPLVLRGRRLIRILCVAFGILMIANACLHSGMSIYLGRLVPGFWSSPILFLSAIGMVVRGVRPAGWQ